MKEIYINMISIIIGVLFINFLWNEYSNNYIIVKK